MSRQPCTSNTVVLTVGIFFEPLVTISKITFMADNVAAPATTKYHFQTVDIVTKIEHKAKLQTSLIHKHQHSAQHSVLC